MGYRNLKLFSFSNQTASHVSLLKLKRFTEPCGIEVLPWPSNSPNMKLSKTLWGLIKVSFRCNTFTTKQDLINKVLEICAREGELRESTELVTVLYKVKGKRMEITYCKKLCWIYDFLQYIKLFWLIWAPLYLFLFLAWHCFSPFFYLLFFPLLLLSSFCHFHVLNDFL